MKFLNDNLLKYGLHDTEVSKVDCCDSKLILIFDSGVYFLNDKYKELTKSKKCKMIIEVENLYIDKMSEHVEITKTFKNKSTEIDYNYFLKELSKNSFQIDLDYYSQMARSILLKGYIDKNKIEFVITEIKSINFLFEE